jgi:hypothetical protein
MYISQIAKEVGIDDKLASFHLATLKDNNLVDSDWKMTEVGGAMKAVRYYKTTGLVNEVLEKVHSGFEKPKFEKPIAFSKETMQIPADKLKPETFYIIPYAGETYAVRKNADGIIEVYEVIE